MKILALAAGLLAGASCATAEAPRSQLLVDLRVGGDVGQTQRLVAALESGIGESREFRLANGHDPDVILLIPHNVMPYVRDGRERVRYEARFLRPGATERAFIGDSRGTCPNLRLERCASRILSDLRSRLNRPSR